MACLQKAAKRQRGQRRGRPNPRRQGTGRTDTEQEIATLSGLPGCCLSVSGWRKNRPMRFQLANVSIGRFWARWTQMSESSNMGAWHSAG